MGKIKTEDFRFFEKIKSGDTFRTTSQKVTQRNYFIGP